MKNSKAKPLTTLCLLTSLSLSASAARAGEKPRSYVGESALTMFSMGSADQAELVVSGDVANALFDGLTAVRAEQESVTGSEGSFLHYRQIKRGKLVTCELEEGTYRCVLTFADRTTGSLQTLD